MLYIEYAVFICIYWCLFRFLGNAWSVKDVLRSLLNGTPIVTDSWFLIVIVLFYFVFALLGGLFKEKPLMLLLGTICFCGAWVWVCRKLGYGSHWYNTCLVFPFGIFWAMYENCLVPFLKRYYRICAVVLVPLLCFLFRETYLVCADWAGSLPVLYFTAIAFCIAIVLLLMKFGLGNRVLGFLGGISMELYLTHRIFIVLLRSSVIYIQNDFLWCGCVVLLSALFAYLFHKIYSWVTQKCSLSG